MSGEVVTGCTAGDLKLSYSEEGAAVNCELAICAESEVAFDAVPGIGVVAGITPNSTASGDGNSANEKGRVLLDGNLLQYNQRVN